VNEIDDSLVAPNTPAADAHVAPPGVSEHRTEHKFNMCSGMVFWDNNSIPGYVLSGIIQAHKVCVLEYDRT
jgi:hypothetical protein